MTTKIRDFLVDAFSGDELYALLLDCDVSRCVVRYIPRPGDISPDKFVREVVDALLSRDLLFDEDLIEEFCAARPNRQEEIETAFATHKRENSSAQQYRLPIRSTKEEWVGCFYPVEIVESQYSRALFSLLFDRIICHFPIAHMGCGGGAGISNEFSDSPLIQHGVIELREEFLTPIEYEFTGGGWGTAEEFAEFTEIQVTSMAVDVCRNEGALPVSDRVHLGSPASYIVAENMKRCARLQASALALAALEISLPSIATDLHDDEILELRYQLRDQMSPFRSAMLRSTPLLRTQIADIESPEVMYQEAKYLVDSQVLPALMEVKHRLKIENNRFWRRVVASADSIAPRAILNWTTKSALDTAIKKVLVESRISGEPIDTLSGALLSGGGIGLLVDLPQYVQRFQ